MSDKSFAIAQLSGKLRCKQIRLAFATKWDYLWKSNEHRGKKSKNAAAALDVWYPVQR